MCAGTLSRSGASPRRAGEVNELDGARHALLGLAYGLLEVAANNLRLTLELGAVALDDADRPGPALAQLALDARARCA